MYYLNSLNSLFFYIFFVFFIVNIIFFLCLIINVVKRTRYHEKISAYECGFDPFSDAREPFSIKFFVIAILFLIFDIETIFFFPWILNLHFFSIQGIISMYIFIIFLLIGFIFEYFNNCLDW